MKSIKFTLKTMVVKIQDPGSSSKKEALNHICEESRKEGKKQKEEENKGVGKKKIKHKYALEFSKQILENFIQQW